MFDNQYASIQLKAKNPFIIPKPRSSPMSVTHSSPTHRVTDGGAVYHSMISLKYLAIKPW
jgi:hypothetical protein